ncbi:cyclic-phosphate processing receiver domain-containing protein [Christiangramia portivictoriae]|uniref:cyclic-phosphate processing receiver domain-containing protein n=1 Tax=Christiangramia portivictoriae TaxID=326069 RepID=UPI0004238471|nr:cyclic-phosphate processing receiver domain-containing protein [Christiangramia portivictoriae]
MSEFKIKNKKTLLWLDDMRDPNDIRMDWLAYSPIGREVEVVWLKDHYKFRNWIQVHGLPDGICFDHDLGKDTPTGYDCAKWLVNYCLDNKLSLPLWSSQSANPVGKANINRLLRNFIKN